MRQVLQELGAMQTFQRVTVLLLFLLLLPAGAQEPGPLLQLNGLSSTDQEALQQSLSQALLALAPYKDKALPADAPLPTEVDQFFYMARRLTTKYKLKGSDLVEVPKALLVGSGRSSESTANEAFGPLQQLLDKYSVRGIEVLDLILPGIKRDLTLGLKTPPDQRAALRKQKSSKTKEQIDEGVAFAKQHNIPLLEFAGALQHLSKLKG
jgi:hypothetical protein